mmetsp:Transcript_20935/g.24156  ORF Transcript_20935/g.24156 Transcript_20935/m.24156 type:complete len:105 (+) Transcript_20935:114-428(+)
MTSSSSYDTEYHRATEAAILKSLEPESESKLKSKKKKKKQKPRMAVIMTSPPPPPPRHLPMIRIGDSLFVGDVDISSGLNAHMTLLRKYFCRLIGDDLCFQDLP